MGMGIVWPAAGLMAGVAAGAVGAVAAAREDPSTKTAFGVAGGITAFMSAPGLSTEPVLASFVLGAGLGAILGVTALS